MTPHEAVERIHTLLAHAWMVRTFLKHSEEIADHAEMLDVHRMIFDYVRALEPSHQRGDTQDYLRRARGKLPKLKKVADYFAAHYRDITDHTNFEMAALSLSACVRQIEDILTAVRKPDAGQK
ncbi:MAG: hypothetical protein ACK4RK_10330 [Gemmataceae bacterium]